MALVDEEIDVGGSDSGWVGIGSGAAELMNMTKLTTTTNKTS